MNTIKNIAVICALSLVMVNTEVMAQSSDVQSGGSYTPADLTARAQRDCSEQSIRGSENAVNNAKRQAQEAMQSALTTPEVRVLSRIDLSIRVMALESLTLNCAILKSLDPGV